MGVINVTPDSFSGDGIAGDADAILDRAERLAHDGADVLDVGGESTRPGYFPVSVSVEMERTIPALELLGGRTALPISVDTGKAEVAAAALARGACVINDVSGLRDPDMLAVASRAGCGLVLVHNESAAGQPNVVGFVRSGLQQLIARATEAGISKSAIMIDPGLGFGKTWRQNLEILDRLAELRDLQCPILVGPSRKATISRVLGVAAEDRLAGTEALVAVSIARGADLVRVHDCLEMVRVARTMDCMARPSTTV